MKQILQLKIVINNEMETRSLEAILGSITMIDILTIIVAGGMGFFLYTFIKFRKKQSKEEKY